MTPILITATALGIYALACWLHPFGRCHWCAGNGARRTLILHRMAVCRMCHGARRRLRYGRRAANYLRTVHHDATTARHTDTPPRGWR